MEVEVSENHGLYLSRELLDFGILKSGGEREEEREGEGGGREGGREGDVFQVQLSLYLHFLLTRDEITSSLRAEYRTTHSPHQGMEVAWVL